MNSGMTGLLGGQKVEVTMTDKAGNKYIYPLAGVSISVEHNTFPGPYGTGILSVGPSETRVRIEGVVSGEATPVPDEPIKVGTKADLLARLLE